ncbi:MAG: alkaline phosphatase family protein [Rudaea sp.]
MTVRIVCALFFSIAASSNTAGADLSVPPRFDHVVIVIMENTSESAIIGNTVDAPYINSLVTDRGVSFSNAHAVTHPSQPNYIALFSGDTQGVTDDQCLSGFSGVASLGGQLIGAGFTFVGYSESMPGAGYTGCSGGPSDGTSLSYQRKHNPWVDFDDVSAQSNQPFSSFPGDFAALPDVAFVVPNMCDDMHDCSTSTGDTWLQNNLDGYVQWAKTHNSLLVLTWDENDGSPGNQIPLVFAGARLIPGSYAEDIDHYSILRTIEDMYALVPLGNAASRSAIVDVWDDDIFANGFETPPP